MKQSTLENLEITLLGIASALAFFLALVVVGHYTSDWEKWAGVGWWTIAVFGLVAYLHFADLKKPMCILVFVSALLLHLILIIRYFPSNPGSLNSFYFIFYPFEVAAVAALMYILGGSRHGRYWRRSG
jgi:hypothetical protein